MDACLGYQTRSHADADIVLEPASNLLQAFLKNSSRLDPAAVPIIMSVPSTKLRATPWREATRITVFELGNIGPGRCERCHPVRAGGSAMTADAASCRVVLPPSGGRLRRTLELAADLYQTARPDYPVELYHDLIRLAGLRPGDRLLEVGCATGTASSSASGCTSSGTAENSEPKGVDLEH